ncbi:MAG: hypothetical protein IAG10_15565 [Planctomycetaceae bacterium]|nr:hypothetical protein [Planctomycetaceae bacterium]
MKRRVEQSKGTLVVSNLPMQKKPNNESKHVSQPQSLKSFGTDPSNDNRADNSRRHGNWRNKFFELKLVITEHGLTVRQNRLGSKQIKKRQ